MDGTKEAAQAQRIVDLETGMRMMRQANVNLLTVIKEYGHAISDIYQKCMGEADAEKDVADFKDRFNFGKS